MFLESAQQVPLLVARKRKKAPTTSFIICQDMEELKKDGESCLAKVSNRAVGEDKTTCWGSTANATARTALCCSSLWLASLLPTLISYIMLADTQPCKLPCNDTCVCT